MKKLVSAVAVGAVAVLACGAMVACGGEKETGAYGLVHGAGYVGFAEVKLNGGKVSDVTLSEVCLPTQVTAPETVPAADKVTSHGTDVEKSYYKTVSYGDVTLVYDATAKTYKSGSTALVDFFQKEENAREYYKAVMSNKVSVSVDGKNDKSVMTKAALSKEENGYWGSASGLTYSRWKANRDATVKYVKEKGLSALTTLVKSTDKAADMLGGDGEVTYWFDANGVNTGATWTDLNTDKENTLSYAQLIVKAAVAAGAEVTLRGEYSYAMENVGTYGQKVDVNVKDGKITKVALVNSDWIEVSDSWTDKETWNNGKAAYLTSFEGKTVEEVKGFKVTKVTAENASQYNPAGTPTAVTGIDIVTGATQSSGRVLLAVQDALAFLK